MIADREGRSPAPKQIGLCSLGTRLVATHRGGSWFWRHYTECKCPDYQPWETSTEARREQLVQMASEGFATPELAEEFRTAALEFLTGTDRAEVWTSARVIEERRHQEELDRYRKCLDMVADDRRKENEAHSAHLDKLREIAIARELDRDVLRNRCSNLEAELEGAKRLVGVTDSELIAKNNHLEAQVEKLRDALQGMIERHKDVVTNERLLAEYRAIAHDRGSAIDGLKHKLAEVEAQRDKAAKDATSKALTIYRVVGVMPQANQSDKDFSCLIHHAARSGKLFKGYQSPVEDDERNPLQIAYDEGYEAGSRKKSA